MAELDPTQEDVTKSLEVKLEDTDNQSSSSHAQNGLTFSNSVDDLSDTSEASSTSDCDRSKLPKVNCPEKIILCLDLSPEMKTMSFQSKANPRTLFKLVSKTVEIFVKTKMKLNPKHEIAIVVLEELASWYQHFMGSADAVCSILKQLEPMDQLEQDTFDLMSLMEILNINAEVPTIEDIILPPPHVVRVILLYGRSTCMPLMSEAAKQALEKLMESPYFFFDVLYVHEIPSEENKCEEIYDLFCALDEEEYGYVLEVSRSTTRLFDHMASLLAHPLQRPRQRDSQYKLIEMNKADTAET